MQLCFFFNSSLLLTFFVFPKLDHIICVLIVIVQLVVDITGSVTLYSIYQPVTEQICILVSGKCFKFDPLNISNI